LVNAANHAHPAKRTIEKQVPLAIKPEAIGCHSRPRCWTTIPVAPIKVLIRACTGHGRDDEGFVQAVAPPERVRRPYVRA